MFCGVRNVIERLSKMFARYVVPPQNKTFQLRCTGVKECKTPIIKVANELGKTICPICGNVMSYLSVDLRPVFPEERYNLRSL